jgi:predicted anti-sigma-YlaC factor YlaD
MTSCRRVRDSLDALELGTATPHERAEVDSHLQHCAACRQAAAFAATLAFDLRQLGRLAPPDVDVRARVLAATAALGRPSRSEVSPRQLGWAAATALACGVVVAAVLAQDAPRLAEAGRAGLALGPDLLAAAKALGSVVVVPLGLLLDLLQAATPLVGLVGAAAVPCGLVMAATIAVVVGLDLRRAHAMREER